jgi:hypothetical protein
VIVAGSDVDMGSGEPGSAWTVPPDAVAEGTEFGKRPPAGRVDAPKHPIQADVPVLGEPGSARVVIEEGSAVVGLERGKGKRKDELVERREDFATESVLGDERDAPAVQKAGKADSLYGEPPKVLSGEKASRKDSGGEPGDPDRAQAPGRTEDVQIHAAAGPHAPMPDISGDEPEPLEPPDQPPAPVGKERTAGSTRSSRGAAKRSKK